jgi:uncharacterized protein
MPTFTSYPTGSPCWVDLASPDVAASKAFYSTVFGWEVEDQLEGDQVVYTLLTINGQPVAGLGGQQPAMEGMPPVWGTYIAVDDVAAAVASATEAGGAVIAPPMQVMDAGEMAVFSDPTGAVISVWKAGNHVGAGICNEPNTWSWNELMDRDVDSAKAFYSKVFGWTYNDQEMGPMGTYSVIEGGDNGLGGLMSMPAEMPDMVPNHWGVYFSVSDLEATIEVITANGGQTVNGPMSVPGVGLIATMHDPSGGSFSLMQGQPD